MKTKVCQFCKDHYNVTSKYDITSHKRNCKSYIQYKTNLLTREFLVNEYVTKERSANEIAIDYKVSVGSIIKYLKTYNIHNRSVKESKNKREKEKRRQTNIKRYGEEHNFSKNHPSRLKWEKEMFSNEGITNVFQRQSVKDDILPKQLETKYRLGLAVRPELLEENIKYKRLVQKITEQNYKLELSKINPNNVNRKRNQYQLDHIVSINYGFTNNIPAEIIAHSANLQMLTEYDNISKGLKCGFTIDELYKRIEQYEYCENKINKKN